nr:histone deacetylase [Methanonatronarchaeum thermophilum]
MAYHKDFLNHKTGKHHPENPERLKTILKTLQKNNIWSEVNKINPPKIDLKTLENVHTKNHIKNIQKTTKNGGGQLDPDTTITPDSYQTALRACGALKKLVENAVTQKNDGIALNRPPGHHALPNKSMGFCIFNNIAVAAKHATKKLDKILIFDWDVHHGNGTQKIFYQNKNPLYISIHQTPLFPNTGKTKETGQGKGKGYNINIPLPKGMTDTDYNYIMEKTIIPKIKQYKPKLILISAGYDAHKNDPLANMNLTSNAYYQMTKKLKTTQTPIVLTLEGGYQKTALANSTHQTINALLDKKPIKKPNKNNQKISKTTKEKTKQINKIYKI